MGRRNRPRRRRADRDYGHEELGAAVGRPTLETSPSCNADLAGWANPQACPGCGLAFSDGAAAVAEGASEVQDVAESEGFESTDETTIKIARALRHSVDDPEELQGVLNALGDE